MMRISRNPGVCYLAKHAGLDFIMFDCEHSTFSFEALHDFFITGNALGLGGFLRVPVGTKDYISRALDAAATGVMVPMTETVEQAQDLVKWSKFAPLGGRGYGSGGANLDYRAGGKHLDNMAAANDMVTAIAQIETGLAVTNADAIAALPGIDALLVGPNDLSLSLGLGGDMMNSTVLDAIAHTAACCKKHGKGFGIHGPMPLLQKFKDSLTIVMCGSDTDILGKGMAKLAEDCKAL